MDSRNKSLNSTRLSTALVDLPLTPFGMKLTESSSQRRQNQAGSPYSKLSRLKLTPTIEKFGCSPTFNKENCTMKSTKFSCSERLKDEYESTLPNQNVDIERDSDMSIPLVNSNNCTDFHNRPKVLKPRNSNFTDIDENGSFVEFLSDGNKKYVFKEPKPPFYYTCNENNDTCFSTSSKVPLPTVGFRKFVDTYRNERRLNELKEVSNEEMFPHSPFMPDESVVAGSRDVFTKPKCGNLEILNSTSQNPDIPHSLNLDLSTLTLNPNDKTKRISNFQYSWLPKVTKSDKECVEISDDKSDSDSFESSDRGIQPPLIHSKVILPQDSLISEDVDVASSRIPSREIRANSINRSNSKKEIESYNFVNTKGRQNVLSSSSKHKDFCDLPSTVESRKKKHVLDWIVKNPLEDASFSKSFMNDSDNDSNKSPISGKNSQHLRLRLSESSNELSDQQAAQNSFSAYTICRVATSPNQKSRTSRKSCQDKDAMTESSGFKISTTSSSIQILSPLRLNNQKSSEECERISHENFNQCNNMNYSQKNCIPSSDDEDVNVGIGCMINSKPFSPSNKSLTSNCEKKSFEKRFHKTSSEAHQRKFQVISSSDDDSDNVDCNRPFNKLRQQFDVLYFGKSKTQEPTLPKSSCNAESIVILSSDEESSGAEISERVQRFKKKIPAHVILGSDESECILSSEESDCTGVDNRTKDNSSDGLIDNSPKKTVKEIKSSSSTSDSSIGNQITHRVPRNFVTSKTRGMTIISSSDDDDEVNDKNSIDKTLKYLTPRRRNAPKISKPRVKKSKKLGLNISFSSDDDDDGCSITKKLDRGSNDRLLKYLTPHTPKVKARVKTTLPTKKITTPNLNEQAKPTPTNYPHKNSRKCLSFLASLGQDADVTLIHPDAKHFIKNFKKHKDELVTKLYDMYNQNVFDKKLPETMKVTWNAYLQKTAGLCYNQIDRNKPLGRGSRIELSTKVIDCAQRLRDTFIHELCHAATWIVSGERGGHGRMWKAWAYKAMKAYPELPIIMRCHNYDIAYKYTYRCTKCGYSIGRHSKSLDVTKKVCGICHSKFELIVNSKPSKTKPQSALEEPTSETAKTPRTPGPFAIFVKENYGSVKSAKKSMKHADVMKELSAKFNKLKTSV